MALSRTWAAGNSMINWNKIIRQSHHFCVTRQAYRYRNPKYPEEHNRCVGPVWAVEDAASNHSQECSPDYSPGEMFPPAGAPSPTPDRYAALVGPRKLEQKCSPDQKGIWPLHSETIPAILWGIFAGMPRTGDESVRPDFRRVPCWTWISLLRGSSASSGGRERRIAGHFRLQPRGIGRLSSWRLGRGRCFRGQCPSASVRCRCWESLTQD